jgi:hypothetical protein
MLQDGGHAFGGQRSVRYGVGEFFRITSRSESISIGFKGPRQPVNGWRKASSASKILGIPAILSPPSEKCRTLRLSVTLAIASLVPRLGLFKSAQLQVHRPLKRLFSWTRGISFVRLLTSSQWSRSAVYTTNMATPAANIATVVIATTVHPKRELGWPCISFLSEATTRIPTRRKGANSPLITAVQ